MAANSSVHRHWARRGHASHRLALVSLTTSAAALTAASATSAATAMACLLGSRSSTSLDNVLWALAGSGGLHGKPLIPDSTGSLLRSGLGVVCHDLTGKRFPGQSMSFNFTCSCLSREILFCCFRFLFVSLEILKPFCCASI
jgi:hypothetical protein